MYGLGKIALEVRDLPPSPSYTKWATKHEMAKDEK